MASGSPQSPRSSQDSQPRYDSTPYFDDRARPPPVPVQAGHAFSNDEFHRARSHSNAPLQPPPSMGKVPSQPIRERVNAAVNQSNVTQDFSPDLVAQITQQVLNSLKLNGINTGQTPSGTLQGDAFPPGSAANPISPRSTYAPTFVDGPSSLASNASTTQEEDAVQHIDGHVDRDSRNRKMPESPERTNNFPKAREEPPRPSAPPRAPTDDATTLEKIWQPLFNNDGAPLPRLGEFLRGLALHIIEDYEPKNSLVITPQKLLRFYEEMKVQKEIYPWKTIFGGKLKHSSLSHLYRDLLCQHHFVQTKRDDKPSVPSLTPLGFQTWMTLMIQAHPDLEYERFTKAVLNMPISNADNRKERFPKELSRRLFPKKADTETRMDIEDAMFAYEEIEFTPSAPKSSSPSPDHKPKSPTTPPSVREKDRDREKEKERQQPASYSSSYPSAPSAYERNSQPRREASSVTDDEDESRPSKPIERQRKPYYAQPGGGKKYDDCDDTELRHVKSDSTQNKSSAAAGPPPPSTGGYRSGGDSQQDDYYERSSRRPRRGSVAATHSQAPVRRQRSPSEHQSSPYARSEGDMPAASSSSSAATYRPANYIPDSSIDARLHPNDASQRRFVDDDMPRPTIVQPPPQSHQSQAPVHRQTVDEEYRRRMSMNSNSRGSDGSGSGGTAAGSSYYYPATATATAPPAAPHHQQQQQHHHHHHPTAPSSASSSSAYPSAPLPPPPTTTYSQV